MPQACTRMRTCPAPGFGLSRSTISKFARGFGTCATLTFAIETLRSLFWIHAQSLGARRAETGTYCGAAELASAEQDCAEIAKKVLQRFPRRCTGTPIDARKTSAHNAPSLSTRKCPHLA